MTTYIIYLDNLEIKRFPDQETDLLVFKFMHSVQSQSLSYALKYSGYKIEEINQLTKESNFWKPY